MTVALLVPAVAMAQVTGEPVEAPDNPILADGEYYSTDPAPVVADGKLWILAGRDEAPEGVNDFVMHEWQLLSTTDPASGRWTHYPAIAQSHAVFEWAAPGRAYAGEIVNGPDGKYYFYASVAESDTDAKDPFAIGVAVADDMAGPWRDAHPSGPIVSQRTPEANEIQNIDPTVLIDDGGDVYMYWGTFGELRAVQLERDMVTPKGAVKTIGGLNGFFEAPWLMKRNGTYYLLYAANNAGPGSDCTPALYHACVAYGTAPSPLGPWTYRGVVLKPVSSTTSHPGAVEYEGQWYLAYHTADAEGGGHFRRSVALDEMTWDDTQTPAAIERVQPTTRPGPEPQPTRNVAGAATASASNEPIPVQYWIKSLNDGATHESPLPPDLWGSWTDQNPPQQWIAYRWPQEVELNGSRIMFWNDQPAGAGVGVAPPASWHLEYEAGGQWKPVPNPSAYGTEPDTWQTVSFDTVKTDGLRAVFDASSADGTNAALAVQEWEALAPTARLPEEPSRR